MYLMVKHNYDYANYLVEKIRISGDTEKELFPNKQDFRLALQDIYFSKNPKKIGELADTLAHYYFEEGNFTDYLKAFEESLSNLNFYAQSADNLYNFQNKEIQEFYKNSIEDVCRFN